MKRVDLLALDAQRRKLQAMLDRLDRMRNEADARGDLMAVDLENITAHIDDARVGIQELIASEDR